VAGSTRRAPEFDSTCLSWLMPDKRRGKAGHERHNLKGEGGVALASPRASRIYAGKFFVSCPLQ